MRQGKHTHSLLFWQNTLLFTALGTLAPASAPLSIFAAILLFIACLHKKTLRPPRKTLPPLLVYLAGFGAGFLAANALWLPAPPTPEWVDENKPQQITARVEYVDSMHEGRIRIILSDVTLADTQETLPAKLAWTWQFPPPEIPLTGELIKTDLRIREVHGMINPGSFSIEDYWLEKGVAFRAWTKGDKGGFERIEPAPAWRILRDKTEKKLIDALASGNTEQTEQGPLISGGKAIILALLDGNKYYLTTEELDLFAAASLSHSLALSGMNLGLMASMGAGLALLVCRLFPGIMLKIPRPKLIVLFASPLVLAYLWLGGTSPPLLRAALMFACWAVLLLRGRPHIVLDGLFWSLLIMLLLNPLALHDIRLQLSAACIAAIGLVLPYSQQAAQRIFPGENLLKYFLRGGVNLLIISTAIQIMLLPLQTWNFGQATPWFILNMLWLPVLSAFIFPLSVLGLILCVIPGLEGLASLVFDAAALPADWLLDLLRWLDNANLLYAPAVVRPAGTASIAYWVLLLVLVMLGAALQGNEAAFSRKKHRNPLRIKLSIKLANLWREIIRPNPKKPALSPPVLILLACSWLATGYYLMERWQDEHPAGPGITLLDVGQGQAVLFYGTEGQRILVDGGGLWGSDFDMGKSVLAPSLTFNRAPRLDALINTHPDRDHIDGLQYLLGHFEVAALYLGQGLPKEEYGEEFARTVIKSGHAKDLGMPPLRAGDELALDSAHKLKILYPELKYTKGPNPEIMVQKSNNASLVIQLAGPSGNLALTCGDIGQSGLRKLIKSVEKSDGASLKTEVLVLPHHGSKTGFSPDFYDAVSPEVALASAGYKNQWGFPVQVIREEMARRKIPLLTTADYGQINVQWDDAGNSRLTFARQGQETPPPLFTTNANQASIRP